MKSDALIAAKKKPVKKSVGLRKKDSPVCFAAIDFETADYGRDSACSLAVVVVKNGKIEKQLYHLIKPPRKDFVFTYIHGIEWGHVASSPTFSHIWDDIRPHLQGVDFIAAHNASFDRSVLRACCEMIGTEMPESTYLCTMKLARRIWEIHPTKLSDVCSKLKIPLKHHDAASDALACATIVMRAITQGCNIMDFVDAGKRIISRSRIAI